MRRVLQNKPGMLLLSHNISSSSPCKRCKPLLPNGGCAWAHSHSQAWALISLYMTHRSAISRHRSCSAEGDCEGRRLPGRHLADSEQDREEDRALAMRSTISAVPPLMNIQGVFQGMVITADVPGRLPSSRCHGTKRVEVSLNTNCIESILAPEDAAGNTVHTSCEGSAETYPTNACPPQSSCPTAVRLKN